MGPDDCRSAVRGPSEDPGPPNQVRDDPNEPAVALKEPTDGTGR
jgi:hypothetical protein